MSSNKDTLSTLFNLQYNHKQSYPQKPLPSLQRPTTSQQPYKPYKPAQRPTTSQQSYKPSQPVPAPAPVPVKVQTIGLKRALLIGINYTGTSNKLNGCINDITNMKALLLKEYPSLKEENIKILKDDELDNNKKPNRDNILDAIKWLVTGLQSGENVYFHYSGHGGLVNDKSSDEQTGKDSCIYPINNGKIEVIIDDELRSNLANKIPSGCKCFAVLDACHSGSALDLQNKYNGISENSITFTQDPKYKKTDGSVIFLSGCEDEQTSADTVDTKGLPSGALTNALIDAWVKDGSNMSWKDLLWKIRKFLKGKYTQIPQLSCGKDLDINSLFNLN